MTETSARAAILAVHVLQPHYFLGLDGGHHHPTRGQHKQTKFCMHAILEWKTTIAFFFSTILVLMPYSHRKLLRILNKGG